MPRDREWQRADKTTIALATLMILGLLGLIWLLAGLGVLDSENAADWVTAIATSGLIIVALLALWPAARQAQIASRAVREAARASAESHRPYVTLMTRPSIEGFLYLDLVNNGDRAALEVSAEFSSPPLLNVKNTARPTAPFGRVSYLAPGERRSAFYSNGRDVDNWPHELAVEITYTGEDGTSHMATVTHDLDALKLILTNPENKKSPQRLLDDGLGRFERIVHAAVGQIVEGSTSRSRFRIEGCRTRAAELLRRMRARGRT